MEENNFLWLQDWFSSHCNGDWEHSSGISIETLDNPGWSITINIEDTELQDCSFEQIVIERSNDDWLTCFIENYKFEGRCGLTNLPEVLRIFRKLAESYQKEGQSKDQCKQSYHYHLIWSNHAIGKTMNEFEERQLSIVIAKINKYKTGGLYLSDLIYDLEALLNILESRDQNWKEIFRGYQWELEQVYAFVLYENREKLNLEEQEIINKALDSLLKLIEQERD